MDYLFTIRGEAMEPEGYKKAGSLRSIFSALVASEPLWALKELFVSFREMREPCRTKISRMKCAPGGLVYHSKNEVGITELEALRTLNVELHCYWVTVMHRGRSRTPSV